MAGIEKLPTERTGMELPACPWADDLPPVPPHPILPQIPYFPIPLPLASVEFTNNGKSKPSLAWLENDESKPQLPW